MIQKEVADRICAGPGTRAYGILSVLIQAWYTPEYLFTVEPNVFNPPPKVRSAVIRMTRNATQELPCDEALFRRVVKTTFNQRRKTLRNNIRPLLNELTQTSKNAHFIDQSTALLSEPLFNLRPEQLSLDQFIELTNRISQLI
jgi:16S rRNA (adenine1518-N6/adenine1519-N6)-dimethyltransferase